MRRLLHWYVWLLSPTVARMCSLFMIAGNDPTAMEHIIQERLTTKPFWRDLMERGGCHIPQQIGKWDGQKLVLDMPLDDTDVVIKLTDAFFGIGDQFLVHGEDYDTAADLEHILKTRTYESYEGGTRDYNGREALIVEFCRPPPRLAVHSLDILTPATSEGVKVLPCLYWGECTGDSSHSTTAGYVVDVEKEVICAPCRWYV